MKKSNVPYDQIDPAMIEVCKAINEFPAITTIESCQGAIDNHRPSEPWRVYLRPIGSITEQAYCSIEFLVYLFGGRTAWDDGFDVSIDMKAFAPWLNTPGGSLYFVIEGRNRHPDELAKYIREMRQRHFVGPRPEQCA